MIMKEDKTQMQNMLQDVVTHFSKNPQKMRSIGSTGSCLYNPPVELKSSIGCAIGMYLSTDVAKKLDRKFDTSIDSILRSEKKQVILPKWMQNMNKNFLSDVQILHDNSNNWNKNNISEDGKYRVERICREYGLNYSKIKFKQ